MFIILMQLRKICVYHRLNKKYHMIFLVHAIKSLEKNIHSLFSLSFKLELG